MRTVIAGLCLSMIAGAGWAQDRRPSHCIALAQGETVAQVHLASFAQPLPDDHTVRLNYVAHASFVLETSGGLTAVTDYTGFLGSSSFAPDVATMNHAHDSHWTSSPDPRIAHVLKGWGENGAAADHHLDLGEMLVRNIPTDIRSRYTDGIEEDGNSIFVFEVAGLCIGHLGHLHHEPTPEQYAAIGRLDVVMAPVDGGMTLRRETLSRMLNRMKSSVVIPMHWFGTGNLESFITEMSGSFDIDRRDESFVELSLRSLPKRPTVVVLQPRFLSEP